MLMSICILSLLTMSHWEVSLERKKKKNKNLCLVIEILFPSIHEKQFLYSFCETLKYLCLDLQKGCYIWKQVTVKFLCRYNSVQNKQYLGVALCSHHALQLTPVKSSVSWIRTPKSLQKLALQKQGLIPEKNFPSQYNISILSNLGILFLFLSIRNFCTGILQKAQQKDGVYSF